MKKAVFAILFMGLGFSQTSLALGPSNDTNAGVTCDYAREKILEIQNEGTSAPRGSGQVSTGAEISQRHSDESGS